MDLTEQRKIIEKAVEKEIEAQQFYLKVSQKLKDPYLREMFSLFADEELRHQTILAEILSSETLDLHIHDVKDFKISETIDEPLLSTDMRPADAIALAIKNEEAAMIHYTHLANACSDEHHRNVLLQLAAMEREHKHKMENAFVDIGYPEIW